MARSQQEVYKLSPNWLKMAKTTVPVTVAQVCLNVLSNSLLLTFNTLRVTHRFTLSNPKQLYWSKGDPIGLKGLEKLSLLTLYTLRVTQRFYST